MVRGARPTATRSQWSTAALGCGRVGDALRGETQWCAIRTLWLRLTQGSERDKGRNQGKRKPRTSARQHKRNTTEADVAARVVRRVTLAIRGSQAPGTEVPRPAAPNTAGSAGRASRVRRAARRIRAVQVLTPHPRHYRACHIDPTESASSDLPGASCGLSCRDATHTRLAALLQGRRHSRTAQSIPLGRHTPIALPWAGRFPRRPGPPGPCRRPSRRSNSRMSPDSGPPARNMDSASSRPAPSATSRRRARVRLRSSPRPCGSLSSPRTAETVPRWSHTSPGRTRS